MAKSQKKQVKRAEWKGYHKINLTSEDELAFEVWRGKNRVQFSDFDILCNNGYKISFSWDSYNEGISAALFCQSPSMAWAGYSLTAWAGDIETAVALLFYKHFIMAAEDWDIAPEVSNKGLSSYG